MSKKPHINYFDLGLYHGKEIDMFLNEIEVGGRGKYTYTVYGFEAHPDYYAKVAVLHSHNKNVNIHNIAIGDKEKDDVKLYLASNGEGNSLFSTKNNVGKDYVKIPMARLSKIIKGNKIKLSNSFNILRFNIEGAEYALMKDLIKSGLYKKFDLFLGAEAGDDILKVEELKPKYMEYMQMLQRLDIIIHPYCYALQNNVSILDFIEKA